MAIQDKYIDADAEAGSVFPAANVSGAGLIAMATTFEIAAADEDNSVYRIFKSIPASLIPAQIWINNDAIAAGTDYDIGFYKPEYGAVIDKDALADGITTLTAAHALGSEITGMTALDASYVGKTIQEIINGKLSTTTKYPNVDICLTANTVGTAAGTVSARALFIQG